jgi:Tfp pilus assembly protein PilF
LERLLALVTEDPGNSFYRYGLAMEYARLERNEEAVHSFAELIERDPQYVASYFQMGRLLQQLGRSEQAREIYLRGITVASQKGDWHAKGELEAALETIES